MAKQKIAVLGGGAGALFAVLAITQQADWRDCYEIVVYQLGWRLGGKGASGRDPDRGWRNVEHGLHIFGGFYHNTFAWLRACYRDWAAIDPARAIRFDDAFLPLNSFTLEGSGAHWRHVDVDFPANPRQPGVDPTTPGITAMIDLLVRFVLGRFGDELSPPGGGSATAIAPAIAQLRAARLAFAVAEPGVPQAGDLVALQSNAKADALVDALDRVNALTPPPGAATGDRQPDWWTIVKIAGIIARGLTADRVFERGYDAIEDVELETWALKHGATRAILESPYSRAGFDFVFGFAGGVATPAHRTMSAGVAMRWSLRLLLTYHGALFWHLAGGMGEIVFAPLYAVLRDRGVDFRFFHRVRTLTLATDAATIATIDLDIQAEPLDAAGYDPLFDHGGRRAWPLRPFYDQLADGPQLAAWGDDLESHWTPRRTETPLRLVSGTDFDLVVLGISLGALKTICGDLYDRLPPWRAMIDTVPTIPVQGAQIWSTPDTATLGWDGPPHGLVTAYAEPLATWADMSFLLRFETARADGTIPRHLSYYCGPLALTAPVDDGPGSAFPAVEQAKAEAAFTAWLDANAGHLLPGAVAAGGVTGAYLHEHVLRTNLSPSDHYVQSPAGARRARLAAGGSGVANLFLAGDWTRTGLDAGCFEAAAMSGLQCAAALTGRSIAVVGGDP